jgi:chromosome segregation ATPase
LSVDRNGNSGSKAYNLSEERYKVLEEELKLKISTLREELDQKQLEFKSLIHEKQVEINSMKDQLHVSTNLKASLEKKLESLTQAIANEKEKVLINEKKAMNYDRLEKRLVELEKFNTEVKQDYEKV